MQVCVTLSANAGVSVLADGKRVWVDAVHDCRQPGFSAVDSRLQQQMLKHPAFENPESIVFTHCHPDHYSRQLTEAADKLWPMARLYLPEPELPGQTLIRGDRLQTENGLTFFRLPHEGQQYADVAHYGLLISIQGRNILIPGDCATASPVLLDAIGERRIHLAILNFPWVTLKKGRQFLEKHLPDAKLLICHLPFEKDDENGYRMAAQRALCQISDKDIRLLLEPLQTENFEI